MTTKSDDRFGIIERVTTPLGFFTLGVLVMEGLLATLSVRATGIDFTVLLVGILTGFGLLCGMVFFLVKSPDARNVLLGKDEAGPFNVVLRMHLTANDIVTIYIAQLNHGYMHEQHASVALADRGTLWSDRISKLQRLGLVTLDPLKPERARLSEEGRALASFLNLFSRASKRLADSGIET